MTLDEQIEGSIYYRIVRDRIIVVYPRLYNTILTIGPVNMPVYDEHW